MKTFQTFFYFFLLNWNSTLGITWNSTDLKTETKQKSIPNYKYQILKLTDRTLCAGSTLTACRRPMTP